MSSTNSSRSNKSSCKQEKRKVRAVTRIRPFFATSTNNKSIYSTELESCVVQVSANHIGFMQQKYNTIVEQTFKFDKVYNTNSKQEDIFSNEVEPLMEHILNGKKCTIFCYGPTGSGKTFTAFGCNDNPGIMARTIQCALEVKFDKMQENMHKNNKYECKILLSSLEIYNERVYDLLSINNNIHLNKQGLQIRQINDEIIVQGLSKIELTSIEQFYEIYNRSMKQRKTAFTVLNAHSSRSHAIFTIYIEQKMHIISNNNNNNNYKTRYICGKISIADLAGSENNKRTENTGDRLTESKNINKSLFALGKVIEALNRGTKPPYRDSILTRLLSDCLGGHSISTMICCVSGSLDECLMTRRCLEFGSNTRKIENKIIAHITTTNNTNSVNNKKRKYIDMNKNNNHNKRIKLTKQTASKSNNDEIHGTPPNQNHNKKKKKIRYSIQPTPSKFIPNDIYNLQKHEQIARNKMIDKIDELTKNVIKITEVLEQKSEESKDEERELSVYKNDSFGLPPVYTPAVANTALAISKIKEARKLEKKGKIKQALVKYKKVKKLLPKHKGLQKKIEKLQFKLESDFVKQLHFDDDDYYEENEAIKDIKRKKKRKTLKKKRNVEINDNFCDDLGHDSNEEVLNTSGFSYTLDTDRILKIMNESTIGQLKRLATIGTSKAAVIVANRPFDTVTRLRKIKGFNTFKSWNKFIENNKNVFQ